MPKLKLYKGILAIADDNGKLPTVGTTGRTIIRSSWRKDMVRNARRRAKGRHFRLEIFYSEYFYGEMIEIHEGNMP